MRAVDLVRRRPVRRIVLLDGRAPHVDGDDVAGGAAFVVLDDACERLERVASSGMGPGPVGRWQRRSLLRSLRAAEPDGGDAIELHPLGANATAEARACLVRTRTAPAARAHLDALVADGVRLVSVTTVARLLARAYRRHPVPRLFVARTGIDERHVLVVDGVPCFSRTVTAREPDHEPGSDAADGGSDRGSDVGSSDVPGVPGVPDLAAATDTAAAVAESLEHLAGRYAAGRIDVGGIGLDDAALEACRALAHVGQVGHVARTDLATTLARRLAEGAVPVGARRRTAHAPALVRDLPGRPGAANGRRRAAATVAAGLASCVAAGAVGHAAATFARTGRLAASEASERATLETRLAAELAALDALHERPLEAAASLARADALEAGAPPGIEAVLTLVATALRDHDAIRVDSIAWSMPSPHERDATFADAASVPARGPDPYAARGAGLDVELAGRVVGAASVGVAQRSVDGFAASLEALAGVGATVRLDSPLERAAGGARVGTLSGALPEALPGAVAGTPGTSGVGADDEPGWRLRFALEGREIGS